MGLLSGGNPSFWWGWGQLMASPAFRAQWSRGGVRSARNEGDFSPGDGHGSLAATFPMGEIDYPKYIRVSV